VQLLCFLLGATALAQEGWGGEQDTEQPPDDALFILPELVSVPALGWPADAPYEPVQVELLLLLDEQGAVEQATPLGGPEPFLTLALQAAPDLVFTPAYEGDVPVAVEVPFTWQITPPPENLVGVVVIQGSDAPAARVSLLLDGQPGLETDDAGRFALRQVPPGQHTLELVDPSLEAAPLAFEIQGGQATEITLMATVIGSDDEAVGVYYARKSEAVTRSLTAEELRTTPGTMGDPVRAVQSLPGVVRTPFDSGWLLVRGGSPRDTGVFIDGNRVPLVYHLGGFTSVLHPAVVGGVDFMPGGTSVRYGRAISGTVDLSTAEVGDELKIEAGADLIHAGAYAQVPLPHDLAFSASIRRSYLDKVLSVVLSPEQAAIAPRFYDWQLRLDAPRGHLMYLGYSDSIDAPLGSDGSTLTAKVLTHRLMGEGNVELGNSTLTFQPVLARDRQTLLIEEDAERIDTDLGALRVEMNGPSTGNWGYRAGVDSQVARYLISEAAGCGADKPLSSACPGLSRSARYASVDPYAQARVGPENGANLVVGLRLSTLWIEDQLLRARPSPRAALSVPIGNRWTAVGTAGVYHQYPPLLYAIGLPTGRYLGLEQAASAGAGVRYQGGRFQVSVDGYGRKLDNLVVFEDDGTLEPTGSGLAYGVESLVRFNVRPVAGWVAYTYSRSLRRLEPGTGLSPSTYDQPHYLVAVATWSLPGNWSLSGRWRYGSGYPRELDEEDAYDILSQQELRLDTSKSRLEPYHALDVKVAKLHDWNGVQLEFYLDIQNTYNRRVAEPVITGTSQDAENTGFGYGLPILPIFGIKGGYARQVDAW
jgi:hypothetical protein